MLRISEKGGFLLIMSFLTKIDLKLDLKIDLKN